MLQSGELQLMTGLDLVATDGQGRQNTNMLRLQASDYCKGADESI